MAIIWNCIYYHIIIYSLISSVKPNLPSRALLHQNVNHITETETRAGFRSALAEEILIALAVYTVAHLGLS